MTVWRFWALLAPRQVGPPLAGGGGSGPSFFQWQEAPPLSPYTLPPHIEPWSPPPPPSPSLSEERTGNSSWEPSSEAEWGRGVMGRPAGGAGARTAEGGGAVGSMLPQGSPAPASRGGGGVGERRWTMLGLVLGGVRFGEGCSETFPGDTRFSEIKLLPHPTYTHITTQHNVHNITLGV